MDELPLSRRGAQSEVTGPTECLRAILDALNATGHRYALVHAQADLDAAVSSDVDLAFDEDPNQVILSILRQVSTRYGARLIQCLHYEIPYGYYYMLAFEGQDRFLHLDCLYDPLGVNRYRLPTTFLLQRTVAGPLGNETHSERKAIYLLMKRAVKGAASREALDVLRTCFDGASDTLWAEVQRWFGPEARPLVAQLIKGGASDADVKAALARLRVCADRRFRLRHPLRYALSLPLGLMRKLRRFVQPTGLFVVILGPDGAGKSTVASLVLRRLTRAFRRTWHFHWRPGLLPKLGRQTQLDKGRPVSEAPPERSKYHGPVSLVRFLYYWLDFIAGYWLIVYPRRAQTTLVVGERYFPDVLVNPQRYGFTAPRWLMRLAALCVPSPDLVLLLTDEPEVIHARKRELSSSAIAAQLAAYRDEMTHWGAAVSVPTAGGVNAVATRASNLILDACARRTARRLRKRGRPEEWRGFPTAARAKVWISDNDSIANALNLYHPYSTWGRLGKSLVTAVGPWVQRRLFKGIPDADTVDRLDRFARFIRGVLADSNIAVSFSTGSPGMQRKLTAQASAGGRVLSYVKIGTVDNHSALLQQEAEMLDWLNVAGLGAASFPKVVASEVCEGHRFLFLTAPTSPGKQRQLEPDASDARFMTAFAAGAGEKSSVEEFSDSIDFASFLATLTRADPATASALQVAIGVARDSFARTPVKLAPCHGDFAPWNTLELQDGSLYVFDWEYASRAAPVLTDLFHRVLMPARLVLRRPAQVVIARLLGLCDDPVLSSVVSRSGIERSELVAYVLLYLIGMAAREHRSNGQVSAFLTEALGHAVSAIRSCEPGRKVLVAAYACEPNAGSEPGVGWNMSQAISCDNEVWVLTRKNNRERIEQALLRNPNPRLHFIYADLPYWARFWKRGGRGIHLYYYLWQFAAWRQARRLLQTVKFDVAHHVTFVNSYQFSFLALLPVPFVWGPVGINPKLPGSLVWHVRAGPASRLRYLAIQLLRVADPLLWLCVARARLIIGINAEVGRQPPISLLGRSKFICHTAIGVDDNDPITPSERASRNVIRVLSVGRLVPIKGFDLTLRAFADYCRSDSAATLVIVGDGPEKSRLQQLSVQLGIQEAVNFVPWLPRHEAMAMMDDADIFLYPSFEGAGMVVLEAMAHGLPVVCLDFGGPGQMVSGDCGIAVKVGNFKDTVSGLANALAALARDGSLRSTMGHAASQRSAHYLWRTRHLAVAKWYSAALSARPASPINEGTA